MKIQVGLSSLLKVKPCRFLLEPNDHFSVQKYMREGCSVLRAGLPRQRIWHKCVARFESDGGLLVFVFSN